MSDPIAPDQPPAAAPPVLRTRASRPLRFLIFCLTVLLTFLFIWLTGLVVGDIGDTPGPSWDEIAARHGDGAIDEQLKALEKQQDLLRAELEEQQSIQATLQQSLNASRSTLEEFRQQQRLAIAKGSAPSEAQQSALAQAEGLFLSAQEQFQAANVRITELNSGIFAAEASLRTLRDRREEQLAPAREEFNRLRERHALLMAGLKLAFLVPLLALAAWLVWRRRRGLYRPIYIALLLAAFWRIFIVMWEYFPRDYFRYIAIVAAIVVVLAFLVRLLRTAARPRPAEVLKRAREGYATHRCPVCDYPISRGPLRFAFWSAKGPHLMVAGAAPGSAAAEAAAGPEQGPYACPACGTGLYEPCAACGAVRHGLLPYCEHCGAAKAADGESGGRLV